MLTFDPENMLKEAIQKARDCFIVGELDYGQEILEQVLRCEPNHQAALQLLGVFHHRCRRYEVAMPYFAKAIELDPQNADNYNNLALCQSSVGRVDDAIQSLNKAIELNPKEAKYLGNIALQYRHIGAYLAAIESLERAINMAPDNTDLWSNLGGIYGEMHQLDKSRQCYEKALEINPNMASAHVDLAYTYSLQGRFYEAWPHYEYRFNHFDNLWFYNNRYDSRKRWQKPDEDLSDKIVLLYCEQGLGDALQFVRYIPMVKAKGCRIILHCSDILRSLFEQSNLSIDEFFTIPIVAMKPEEVPVHDWHASLLSLPYLLRLDNDHITGHPYLKPQYKADLGYKDHVKIGICWAGSVLHPNDRIRSCYLKYFKELHDTPGVKLFNLQQNVSPRIYANQPDKPPVDYTAGVENMSLVDLSEYMTDFLSTANLLEDLDMVITVDTALLHLAGGMGLKTIGLLSYNPDWRWGIEGNTTKWYESVTLIRQEAPGDWSSVFSKLIEQVKSNCKKHGADGIE